MTRINDRLKLLLNMDNHRIPSHFVKSCSSEKLLEFCEELEKRELSVSYSDSILKIWIEDKEAIDIMHSIQLCDLFPYAVETLVSDIIAHGEKISDYGAEQVLKTLQTDVPDAAMYSYLKYFSQLPLNQHEQYCVEHNLSTMYRGKERDISSLSESQRDYLKRPYIHGSRLISSEIVTAIQFITSNIHLMELVEFLYSKEVNVTLVGKDYEVLSPCSEDVLDGIKSIYLSLDRDKEQLECLLDLWSENGCVPNEIQTIVKRIEESGIEYITKASKSGLDYAQMIHGTKLGFLTEEMYQYHREELLVYAISQKKKAFLKLVENDNELFLSIGSDSILFESEFYAEYIDINTINAANLKSCRDMKATDFRLNSLPVRQYTFNELSVLFGAGKKYRQFYSHLGDVPVDSRINLLRQLSNRKLIHAHMTDEDIAKLAYKLCDKDLYRWMNEDFKHIKELTRDDAIVLLIHYDSIAEYIPQIRNRAELQLLIRLHEGTQDGCNLADFLEKAVVNDDYWLEVCSMLDLSEDFLEKHHDSIMAFLLSNGAGIAKDYIPHLNYEQRRDFLKIVKAELMGELHALKYFSDDLKRELEYPVTQRLKENWTENNLLESTEGITVKEVDGFFDTMLMGIKTGRTCLSHVDGMYNHCLMSCFDSNKKIIYALLDGKTVGRAIIRLTKGRFTRPDNDGEFGFVDLEKIPDSGSESERIVLFLERYYVHGVPGRLHAKIIAEIIKLAELKAKILGCELIISSYYKSVPGYEEQEYYLFISKSKAGYQYLDSLDGEAGVDTEGSYKQNTFLLRGGCKKL